MYRMFEIEGHRLAVLPLNPASAGEPIVLIHGINLSPAFWRTDAVFTKHGPCHALALPGHFPAAFPNNMPEAALTPELIARLLSDAIREIGGGQRVTLAGISTGGFATLAVAAHAPELVRRVVSISGFAEGRWNGLLGRYQGMLRESPPRYRRFRMLWSLSNTSKRFFRNSVWPYFVADRAAFYRYPQLDALTDTVYADWQHQDMDAIAMYYRRMPDVSIAAWLPKIQAPTLVITGDVDPIVPPAQSHMIARHVPNAEIAVVEGAGHMIFAERPESYEAILNDWLRRTAPVG